MLRSIGASLVVIGLLTAAVLAVLGGRGTPFSVSTPPVSWSIDALPNGSLIAVAYTETPLEVPVIEGYSFKLQVHMQPSIRYMSFTSPPGGGAVGPAPARIVEGRIYLLKWRDALAARALFDEGRWEELISMAREKRIAAAELRMEKSRLSPPTLAASLPLSPGRYGYVLLLRLNATAKKRGGFTAYSIFSAGDVVTLNAVVSPTPGQYVRALDVAGLGAIILLLDYYANREEYLEGRLARLLRRLQGRRGREARR